MEGLAADPVAQVVAFGEGDRILLCTDGFLETRDRSGRFYDLADRASARSREPLDDLVNGLRADLLRHAAGDLEDDAALLVVERSAVRA
ncbi:SpoIIE family protein phosphatase [Streptomyces sp. NPDC006368]|uniref:SpoIIE family protein phosphatase n=1 Tax=Streptomyces sp. NPDC006368 TaxID=3156760 RepID=UPI0033A14F66